MARYDLARLVYAVLGLVDSVYSGDAQCVVPNMPPLAPSLFDEGCPLRVDAIADDDAIAVQLDLADCVALYHSQRVVLSDGARYLFCRCAADEDKRDECC